MSVKAKRTFPMPGFEVYSIFQRKLFSPKMFASAWIHRKALFLVFLTIAVLLFSTISIDVMKVVFRIRQVNIHSHFISMIHEY
jgi:hypothetical protein